MTMRLDIVTNDAGDLVRREHARELGAGVVVALYRFARLAQMHDLGNQAFIRQLDQTHQMIGEYGLRSGSNVSVLFADKATFVAGQLLKGNRGAYEAASELGALLEALGGSELHIARDVTREELHVFAEALSTFHRTGVAANLRLPAKIHLRKVADSARLRGIDLEDLTPDQRIVRAYGSAVVIMRRFFEDLTASRYVLPRRIKRIAQSLVDLSDASAASYLGVTEARNANHDEAGRAVNTAIVAVAVARESTHDRTTLSQIAMAAMMHDVARPRALALAGAGGAPIPGMAGPSTLSEDQEDRLAAGAAAVLTALGRVNEPTITRTVLTFEALWLRRQTWLGPVYWGARAPTIHATIIAVARRYNDLLTPEPGLAPPTTDYAVATLASELTDPQDRTVLRMLVSALGLLPTGTVVQLSTGEVAEVVRGTRGLGDKPRVKLLADVHGGTLRRPIEIELADDARRTVQRVLGIDGWQKGLVRDDDADEGYRSDDDVEEGARSASVDHAPSSPDPPGARDSVSGVSGEPSASASIPSIGTSPSAVAEAMGQILNASVHSPTAPPRDVGWRASAVSIRPIDVSTREASARGTLAATPLPHVLVYMLDHALTGSVVFERSVLAPDAVDDTIYFVNGVPAKVRLGEPVARLGEVLVDSGALDVDELEHVVTGARHVGLLLGRYLVDHDLVSRESLAKGLETQLLRKIAHITNLASEISYSYYRDVDLLEDWGADTALTHPLNPILASVRHWGDRSRVRATLNRIGKHPLLLHSDSDLTNLSVVPEEQPVLDAIRDEGMPLQPLLEQNLADGEVVSSLVYSLAVTRQFAFKGQTKGPMAARGAAWRSVEPPASGAPVATAASGRPASSSDASSSGAMVSGSRPAISTAPKTAVATSVVETASPPTSALNRSVPVPSERPALRPPSAGIGASGLGRAHVPAFRPVAAGARPGGPQIRPAKRPTIAGVQPALPSRIDSRPSKGQPAMRSSTPDVDDSSDPSFGSDDAQTIVREAPSLDRTGAGSLEVGDAQVAGAESAIEAKTSFRLAESALKRNDVASAEAHARKAVLGDPTEADYVTLLAWIRSLGGASQPMAEAMRTISKVLIEDPSNERALFYRGKLLVRMNRFPEALIDFNELLAANPQHREAQNEVRQLKTKV